MYHLVKSVKSLVYPKSISKVSCMSPEIDSHLPQCWRGFMRSERATSSYIAHRPNKTLKDPEREGKKKEKKRETRHIINCRSLEKIITWHMYVDAKSLIAATPQCIWEAISFARRWLPEKTAQPSPYFESLASLTASSSVLNFIIGMIGPNACKNVERISPCK